MKHSSLMKWGVMMMGGLILASYAFYNGYPILFSDSGTYIYSGQTGIVPVDRPIFYGFFIRLTSFGKTLWGPILAQSFFLSGLLWLLVRRLTSFSRPSILFIGLLIFLSYFTAVSYTSSTLLPDIFTPVVILLTSFILTHPLRKKESLFCCVGLLMAMTFHASHLLLSVFMYVVFLGMYFLWFQPRVWFKASRHRLIFCGVLIILSWILIPLVHSCLGYGFKVTKSSHVLLVAKMSQSGLLKIILEDNCHQDSYPMCRWKDKLPATVTEFMYGSESPLSEKGGSWVAHKEEYDQLIHLSLTKPRYLLLHVEEVIRASLINLFMFDVEIFGPYKDGDFVVEKLKEFFPQEFSSYLHSEQTKGWPDINFISWSQWQKVIVYLSLFGWMWILSDTALRRILPRELLAFSLLGMTGVGIHTILNGVFVDFNPRLMMKVWWLAPFLFSLLLAELFQRKKRRTR